MNSFVVAEVMMTMVATAPATGAAGAGVNAAGVEVHSVWDFVVKGGPMMIPIGLCSLVAVTVFIERMVSLRRGRIIPKTFLPELKERMTDERDGVERALEHCRDNDSPVAKVFAAGLKRMNGALEQIERHIQEAGEREVVRLRKNLRALSVIAAVAPLMGLLGTILGMITAFQTVATSAEALGRTELLAAGIYEAMITTAAGLVVAIPSLLAYHWVSARIQRLVIDMDLMSVEFIESLMMHRTEESEAARDSMVAGVQLAGSGRPVVAAS